MKVEDFSAKVHRINPENGYEYDDCCELKVNVIACEDGVHDAYTFNSDRKTMAEQIIKAVRKYGAIKLHTGVTGCTANDIIQYTNAKHVKEMTDDIEVVGNSGYRYYSLVYKLKSNDKA